MRKLFKVAIWVVATVGVVAGAAVAFAYFGSEWKLNRTVTVEVKPVPILIDEASLARGKYLFDSRGCSECHGRDGAGKILIGAPDADFYVKTPNITTGTGSAVAAYSDADWVRTIRHGVKPNGNPLFVMPSEDFARMTDEDTGAIIAYAKSLAPVAGGPMEYKVPLIVRFMYAAGFAQDAAEKIDHTLPPAQPVAGTDTLALGQYVAQACTGCHNQSLTGGPIPGGPPDWPAAANLTPGEGSALAHYPDDRALIAMFRTGKRPDGSAVSDVMPFPSLKEYTDADIKAVYAFLKSLQPMKQGEKAAPSS